jgi:hypothetical protein
LTSTERTLRKVLLLSVLAAVGWWIHEKKLTVQEVVDNLTRPLLGSNPATREPEQKRIAGEASQVLTIPEDKPVGAVRQGMSETEVRRLLGDPDDVQTIVDDVLQTRWTYRGAHRVIVFHNHRVVSMAVR